MPSRLPPPTGYPDTSPPPQPYSSWHPQQQQPPQQPQQPKPFYPYEGGPVGSYDSRQQHAAYPQPQPQRFAADVAPSSASGRGGEHQPPQQPVEERQGPTYGHGYASFDRSNERNPEGPASQDKARASPPSRNNSYDHQQQQQQQHYARPHENTSYVLMHSRSNESAGSTEQTSPPKYSADTRAAHPPAPFREQPVPHSYVAGQHAHVTNNRAPYTNVIRGQFAGWTYGSTGGPFPPPPLHSRRSLAPEFTSHASSFDGSHLSRQGSVHSTQDEKGLKKQAPPAPAKARATSPTQLESSRRDEVANMGCTCKKSKCLKLYCMCFGASVVCGPNCRCLVCFNTPDHEADRKEAVRLILLRNPSAFDTKFKKTADKTAKTASGNDRVLSHKIGCKCRKSACTKKYCECFNAGIKCSATCRCTGCQNMPPGGFGSRDPRFSYPMAPQPPYPAVMPTRNTSLPVEEHASVAAQSLAFLKHSSPNKPGGKPTGPGDPRTIASMPSLTSSEATGASETDMSPQASKVEDGATTSEGGVASVLLMAAYAMTEMRTEGSPPKAMGEADPVAGLFRSSPKRKSLDSVFPRGEDTMQGESSASTLAPPMSESPLMTPAKHRKSKRSRVGTHKKSRNLKEGNDNTKQHEECSVGSDDEPENKSPASSKSSEDLEEEVAGTPSTRALSSKSSPKDVLTPVSARCIDFRRMGMNGNVSGTDGDGSEDGKAGEQKEIAA